MLMLSGAKAERPDAERPGIAWNSDGTQLHWQLATGNYFPAYFFTARSNVNPRNTSSFTYRPFSNL